MYACCIIDNIYHMVWYILSMVAFCLIVIVYKLALQGKCMLRVRVRGYTSTRS